MKVFNVKSDVISSLKNETLSNQRKKISPPEIGSLFLLSLLLFCNETSIGRCTSNELLNDD